MKFGRADYDARIIDTAGVIPVDEPVLLIRATDEFAAPVAYYLASMMATRGVDNAVVQSLRQQAKAIEFHNPAGKKVPTLPSPEDIAAATQAGGTAIAKLGLKAPAARKKPTRKKVSKK